MLQPFFHNLAGEITQILGEENTSAVISTTIAAFSLSAILTGLTFFILGYLRLGIIIGFFPRHILVGCIGGVGVFLIQTGWVSRFFLLFYFVELLSLQVGCLCKDGRWRLHIHTWDAQVFPYTKNLDPLGPCVHPRHHLTNDHKQVPPSTDFSYL